MRKLDAETYEPVEQAETIQMEVSPPERRTFLMATVLVATFVLLWWFLSGNRS